jgi:hypothetical protein
MLVLSLISLFIWPRGGEQPQSAGTSESGTGAAASGSGARPDRRGITPAHLIVVAILLGLSWGVIGQALRDLRLVSDLAIMFLSLVVVLGLCLSAISTYRLRWPVRGPGRVGGSAIPLRAGALAALFLTSAVTSHYMYYIATLALGLGQQGASLDLGQPGAYQVLWQLFKTSVVWWLLLAAGGGFCFGWLLGWLPRALGRVRLAGRSGHSAD